MQEDDLLVGLVQELRRGTIVLAVLSQLENPMYGYNLVTVLCEHGLPVEANTLYPLLRRLENQEVLQSSWETTGAKPRKYYTITEKGRRVYGELKKVWATINGSMDQLLNLHQ